MGIRTPEELVQYVTTFECSICGAHRVLIASIQVYVSRGLSELWDCE